MRCMHLNRNGGQCTAEAVGGVDFCADHYSVPDAILESEIGQAKSRIPYVYRLAALALLLIFLFNAYQTLQRWLGH